MHDEFLHLVGVSIKENILVVMKRAKMETTIDDMLTPSLHACTRCLNTQPQVYIVRAGRSQQCYTYTLQVNYCGVYTSPRVK